jgi:ribosome-associated protein
MDYVDFIIHIMTPEKREFYLLEKLWSDAKIEKIKDDLEKS